MAEKPRLERVARAMCKASGVDPDEMIRDVGADSPAPMWTFYVDPAQTFIAAMEAYAEQEPSSG